MHMLLVLRFSKITLISHLESSVSSFETYSPILPPLEGHLWLPGENLPLVPFLTSFFWTVFSSCILSFCTFWLVSREEDIHKRISWPALVGRLWHLTLNRCFHRTVRAWQIKSALGNFTHISVKYYRKQMAWDLCIIIIALIIEMGRVGLRVKKQ